MTPQTNAQQSEVEFWQQLGEHVAVITANFGLQFGLALLAGVISKKTGINVSLTPTQ
jgi:hypothetical protein